MVFGVMLSDALWDLLLREERTETRARRERKRRERRKQRDDKEK